MAEIDMRCFCEPCEARTQETYRIVCRCANCGERHVATIRHGDKFQRSAACPTCGNSWTLNNMGLEKVGGSREASVDKTPAKTSSQQVL